MRDRTNAGLAAVRARGRSGGRPKKLDEEQRELVTRLYKEGTQIPDILRTMKISKGTLYSYVREETAELEGQVYYLLQLFRLERHILWPVVTTP